MNATELVETSSDKQRCDQPGDAIAAVQIGSGKVTSFLGFASSLHGFL